LAVVTVVVLVVVFVVVVVVVVAVVVVVVVVVVVFVFVVAVEFDVGNLGPMSWVNRRVLEGRVLPWGWMKVLHAIGIWQPRDHWRKALEWTEDPNHRTSVYDGAGLVTDASQAPRGFPTFSQLREWGVPVPS